MVANMLITKRKPALTAWIINGGFAAVNLEKACSRAFLKDAHFGCMRRGTRQPEHDVDGCGGWQIESFTCKGQDIRERVEHLRLPQILGIDRKIQAFVESGRSSSRDCNVNA